MLRVENGETHGFNSAALAFTPEQKDDLQRYLDVTRAEMLFARGVIFVEGVTEQCLVPAFAAAHMQKKGLGTSLDDLGITVCSVNGTDFAHSVIFCLKMVLPFPITVIRLKHVEYQLVMRIGEFHF